MMYNYNSLSCNPTILRDGVTVMDISGDATRYEMEEWVSQLRLKSGQPVDWLVFCGRDVIKTTGDVTKVKEVALELYPQLYSTVVARKGSVDEYEQRFLLSYNLRV